MTLYERLEQELVWIEAHKANAEELMKQIEERGNENT